MEEYGRSYAFEHAWFAVSSGTEGSVGAVSVKTDPYVVFVHPGQVEMIKRVYGTAELPENFLVRGEIGRIDGAMRAVQRYRWSPFVIVLPSATIITLDLWLSWPY